MQPGCELIVLFFALFVPTYGGRYEIPDVLVEVLKPKGFRVSIPDAPGVGLFVFQGNINRKIGSNDVGTLSGEVIEPTDARWVFVDHSTSLQVGDVIHFYVFVSVNGSGYVKDNLNYTVTDTATPSSSTCVPSVTTARGMSGLCSGQTVLMDNFDSLKDDIWQVEHKIPVDHPEYPFITYQRSTVKVEDNKLRIKPVLQQHQPGFNEESMYKDTLDLIAGCTGTTENSCELKASGAYILPPVVAGRITSRGFVFRYGIVEIKAKLPLGDWLYPEILLQPFLHKYGTMDYSSGLLKIATARGNRKLNKNGQDYGSQLLYGGPIISQTFRDSLLSQKTLGDGRNWGDDYHVYSVRWTPDQISLSVDGEVWGQVKPKNSLFELMPAKYQQSHHRTSTGSKIQPFDEEMMISLGVSAGGITEFPDDALTTGSRIKPWRNSASKAKLNFWQDLPAWYPTWEEQSSLMVDYVKVIAL